MRQRVAERSRLQSINPAKMASIERRLARFLANDRIVVTKIWEHFASQMLSFWQGKSRRFVRLHTISRGCNQCVCGSARAFTGFARRLGSDAGSRAVGRATMEHGGTPAGSCHPAFLRSSMYLARRSRFGSVPVGENLPRSAVALPLAGLQKTDLSAQDGQWLEFLVPFCCTNAAKRDSNGMAGQKSGQRTPSKPTYVRAVGTLQQVAHPQTKGERTRAGPHAGAGVVAQFPRRNTGTGATGRRDGTAGVGHRAGKTPEPTEDRLFARTMGG